MDKHEKIMEQPLMSTGTPEPGFQRAAKMSQPKTKPKIGQTEIGVEKVENKR